MNSKFFTQILPAVILSIFSWNATAATLDGVTMADRILVQSKPLILNGMGTRTKQILFVKVKVYTAGLYVESKTDTTEKVLTDGKVKRLDMQFLHEVSKDQLMGAWREGIEKNCDPGLMSCSQIGLLLEKLEPHMSSLAIGDRISLTFLPAGIIFVLNNQPAKVISGGSDFSKIMLSAWFGKTPPNQELQDGLLGK